MTPPSPSRPHGAADLWWSFWPILAGLAVLLAFYKLGETCCENYRLDLGSTIWPTPGYTRFVLLWAAFGTAAAGCIGVGLARLASRDGAGVRVGRRPDASRDRPWLVLGAIAGLLIPLVLRRFLLHDAPLTDDESAYRFAAELLASGRLWVESPPLKLFFDRAFIINDGHYYPQYFIGWPALMVPGLWWGDTGVMNAVYSGLTVPALFLAARRLAGSPWAKAAVVLYLASPMLMAGAATEMSHTSCFMALAWMTWCVLRTRDADARWWSHTASAFFFGLAFFIRPSPALGIGLPMLVWWGLGLRMLNGRQVAVRLVAFAVPALVLAGAFLAVNKAQNGSFTTTSYQRVRSYIRENGYRFTVVESDEEVNEYYFRFDRSMATIPAHIGSALFRLNFDAFGWPCSVALALCAVRRREARLLWLSLISFLALHVFLIPFDSGIDSFGPVHYYETVWPILLLSAIGLRALSEHRWFAPATEGSRRRVGMAHLPSAGVAALVVVALTGFVPVRFGAVARIAENINMPRDAVAQARLHRALVFVPRPYAPACRSEPTRHYVFWWPTNDPDFSNDVLWANHLTVEQDRRLLGHFPGRQGYVLLWSRPCNVHLVPLQGLGPGAVADGYIGGTGEGLK